MINVANMVNIIGIFPVKMAYRQRVKPNGNFMVMDDHDFWPKKKRIQQELWIILRIWN